MTKITLNGLRILKILLDEKEFNKQEITNSRLSMLSGITSSHTHKLRDEFIKLGLINELEKTGREKKIKLTPKGKKLALAVREILLIIDGKNK